MSTEISEHAKEAIRGNPGLVYWEHERPKFEAMVQHGINLATAERDKEIQELRHLAKMGKESEHRAQSLSFQVAERDARIAELEAERDMWRSTAKTSAKCYESKDREIERLKEEVSHLSGIRARFVLNHIDRICGECGHDKDEDGQCANCMTAQLSSAQAEIKRLKVQLDIAFHPSHLTPTNETP